MKEKQEFFCGEMKLCFRICDRYVLLLGEWWNGGGGGVIQIAVSG